MFGKFRRMEKILFPRVNTRSNFLQVNANIARIRRNSRYRKTVAMRNTKRKQA